MFGIGFWELAILVVIALAIKFLRKAAIENNKQSEKEE